MSRDTDGPDLRADDPRLSEWIDGRLPAAEAAAVARLVAASPDLARVAADLRRLKAVLRNAPAADVPAGFVADVLAALDAPPRLAPGTASGPADARVDAEWERIELERIAGEIAEAREDAAVAETTPEPRHHWPWMTMAAALAAGVLVAAFINLPAGLGPHPDTGRDVALRDAEGGQGGLKESVDRFFDDDRAAANRTDEETDGDAAVVPPATARPLARHEEQVEPADKLSRTAGNARDGSKLKDEARATLAAADSRGGDQVAGVGGGAGGGGGGRVDGSRDGRTLAMNLDALAAPAEAAAAKSGKRAAPLIVAVRGPEGRAEFAALLAARGIRFESERLARRHETETDGDLVEISGPPAAIQDLISTLDADAPSRKRLAELAGRRMSQEDMLKQRAAGQRAAGQGAAGVGGVPGEPDEGRRAVAPPGGLRQTQSGEAKPGEVWAGEGKRGVANQVPAKPGALAENQGGKAGPSGNSPTAGLAPVAPGAAAPADGDPQAPAAESVAKGAAAPQVRLLVRLIDIDQAHGFEAAEGGGAPAESPAADGPQAKDAETIP